MLTAVSTATVLSKADLLSAQGAQLHGQGNVGAAYLHYLAALTLDPNHISALQNLSAVLLGMNKFVAAEATAARALASEPGNVHIQSNRGVAILGQRRFAEAQKLFQLILQKYPEMAPIWHNLGLAKYMVEDFGGAVKDFDKALAFGPSTAQIESDRALALLALGQIQKGLEAYEIRWANLFKSRIWDLGLSEWQGQDLRGKNLLVHHEQGFGDGLMLVRFAQNLHWRGANITLAVPAELIRLFELNFEFCHVVDWASDINSEGFDYHSPLLSVVRWLGIESPKNISSKPYLEVQGQPRPEVSGPYRIGLCWASGNHSAALSARRRVVSLEAFLPLAIMPEISLVSLQKGAGENDIEDLGLLGLMQNGTSRVTDFADTADLISTLDLVISVDSAVAHLAGAMGKKVLMLGPSPRCWRWWGIDSGLPWYENFEIYAQESNGSWDRPVADVIFRTKELCEKARNHA
jgi:tetratricopeptide (TPR) repeat protein